MASKACSLAAFKILDRDVDGRITVKDLQRLLEVSDALSAMVGEGLELNAFRKLLRSYFLEEERPWSKVTFRSSLLP